MASKPEVEYNIFVSYALADDLPPFDKHSGWVTTFVNHLNNQLRPRLEHKNTYSLWVAHELRQAKFDYVSTKEQRLRQKIESQQRAWELVSRKLSELQLTRILETRVEEKFRLDEMIKTATQEYQQIETELDHLETQILPQESRKSDDFVLRNAAEEAEYTFTMSELIKKLQAADVVVIILSRSYLMSDWYQQKDFLRFIQKRSHQPDSPVFVIEIERFDEEKRSSAFTPAKRCRFWEADFEGNILPISGEPGSSPNANQYYTLVDDLSRDIMEALGIQNVPVEKPDLSATVFLADMTDDLYSQREDVKRSLKQFGLDVLPETNYSLEVSAFRDAMRDDLGQSDLFVQLLSALPGRTPPELPQGYVRYQYELAEEMQKPILQWRAPELDIDKIHDAEYRDFLQLPTVRGDIGIEGLKDEIVKKLQKQKPSSSPTHPAQGKLVFINADDRDSRLCDKVCGVLDEEEQIEYVQFTPSNHQETSIRKAFETWIIDCDAFMLMYGQVDFGWLNQVFRNVRKIVWKREKRPLPAYIVCDPPPEQRQLLRLKIRGMKKLEYGSWSDKQKLYGFIDTLRAEGSL